MFLSEIIDITFQIRDINLTPFETKELHKPDRKFIANMYFIKLSVSEVIHRTYFIN